MGLVHSDTIPDGLTEIRAHVLDALQHRSIPDWMRADLKVAKGNTFAGLQYLNSQRDLAEQSDNGAIARFYVFSPVHDSWPLPESVAERTQTYLQSSRHESRLEELGDGQFFKGVFVVADLNSAGDVEDVSLEAVYWD